MNRADWLAFEHIDALRDEYNALVFRHGTATCDDTTRARLAELADQLAHWLEEEAADQRRSAEMWRTHHC